MHFGRPILSAAVGAAMLATPFVAMAQTSDARPALRLTDLPAPAGPSVSLFNGKDLSNWEGWLGYPDPAVTFRAEPGMKPLGTSGPTSGIFSVAEADGAPAIHVRGDIWGSLTHQGEFADYHLSIEYKWGAKTYAPRIALPRNNGLLFHTHGPKGAAFGTWQASVEFEIMEGSTGMLVPVGTEVRTTTDVVRDETIIEPKIRYSPAGKPTELINGSRDWNAEVLRDVEKPAGQWNRLDLYAVGDRAIFVVNGVAVMTARNLSRVDPATGKRTPLTKGAIQLQSEGAEAWFRNMTLTPIKALPRVVVER